MSVIDQDSASAGAAANVGAELGRPARKAARRRIEPFAAVSYVTVTLFGLFCLVPLWMIVAGSLTDESVLGLNGYSLFPSPFSLRAYELLFTGQSLLNGYIASLFITVVGTLLSISCTAAIAWVIARRLPFISRPLTIFAYIPMLFNGGLVPFYLLVTQVLGLTNSWFAMILPLMLAPFLIFVTVSFFRQMPEEILDAARIDGAANSGSSSRSSCRCPSRSSRCLGCSMPSPTGTSGSRACSSSPIRTSSRCN